MIAQDYRIYHNGHWISAKQQLIKICAVTGKFTEWQLLADTKFYIGNGQWSNLNPFVSIDPFIFLPEGQNIASITPTYWNPELTGFIIVGASQTTYVQITINGLTITARKLQTTSEPQHFTIRPLNGAPDFTLTVTMAIPQQGGKY